MIFRIIYAAGEHNRVIPAVMIDLRSVNGLVDKTGAEIKAGTDAFVQAASQDLFYKIETGTGNLAGYFTIRVSASGGVLGLYQLRPAFTRFNSQVSTQILNFITTGDWRLDL